MISWQVVKELPAKYPGLAAILPIFMLSRLAFYLAALSSSWFIPEALTEPARVTVNGPLLLELHWRWDAIHYYSVSMDGYGPQAITPFFPLLPLLISGLAVLLGGLHPLTPLPIQRAELAPLLAGVLVCHVVALLAFWLIFQLVREESGDVDLAQRAVLYTAVFPLAFYYAVPYTEGLCLATSVGVFLAARRDQWLGAGLCAALASATRVSGILLGPSLALEIVLAWRRGRLRGAAWSRALLGMLIAPAGLLAFMAYLWQRTGDPLAYFHAQEAGWKHQLVSPLQTLARGISLALHPALNPTPDHYARGVLHTLIVIAFLLVSLASLRVWRPSYSLYAALLFLFILASPMPWPWTMHSLGRYVMVLFPVYLTLAHWGTSRVIHRAILITWLPLYGLLTALYEAWYPVA